MLGGSPRTTTNRSPEQHGEFCLAAKHVVDLCRLVDDLIHGNETEGHHAPVYDWAVAGARGPDRHSRECTLGDGGGPHSPRAELREQRVGRIGGEVEDFLVGAHFFGQRL